MRYSVFPPVFLFIVFSAPAAAQTGTVEYFSLKTEDSCWIRECRANHSNSPSQVLNLWQTGPGFPPERSHENFPDFRLNLYPAIKTDTGFQPDRYFAHIGENPNFTLLLISSQEEDITTRYDLFRNEDKGFGAKFLRASFITQTAQVVNLMLMIQFPDHFNYSISSWTEAKINLKRAWTSAPVWDKDPWTTNLIGHPYVGSFYYNMMRSQGSSAHTSVIYATGQSLFWEFVIEAVAEQPSIQDLLFTSTIGSLMGEFAHKATLRLNRNGFSTFEKILITLINPSYVLNNGYKKRHRILVSHH
jgi:hypothetical protein